MDYFETSAATGENIEVAFLALIKNIVNNLNKKNEEILRGSGAITLANMQEGN